MKKKYISPNTELVMVCGQTHLLDNKFGNSAGVQQGGTGDDDPSGDEQFAKPHNVWEEERVGGNGLWD